jgi:branched-chain amino acid transport system permease protein
MRPTQPGTEPIDVDARRTASPPPLAARGLSSWLGQPGSLTQATVLVVLALGALWAAVGSTFVDLVGQSCAVFAIASLGQYVLIGTAGQVALSGAAFMAIGAFGTGMLADAGAAPFPVPLLVSAVVGFAVGLISGLPGLRFRGLYLLLASLALLFIVTVTTQNYEQDYHPGGLIIPPLRFLGFNLGQGKALYLTLLCLVLLSYACVSAVERTGIGLAWRAVRESEVAAAISGIDVVRWKLYAFALSGAITTVAGSLYGYVVGVADSAAYDLTLSISLLTMVFIGGVGSRLGAILGAAVITVLPYVLQNNLPGILQHIGVASSWYQANESNVNAGLFSLLFLVVVLFEPGGIHALLVKLERALRARARHRRAAGGTVGRASMTDR